MSEHSNDALAMPPVSAVERGRRAYRRKQTVRSILISLASTIVVAGVLIAVVVNSDGWEATRNTFFNGKYFVEAFPQVLSGLWLNIRILAIAALGVAVFATLLAAAPRWPVPCSSRSVSWRRRTRTFSEASPSWWSST